MNAKSLILKIIVLAGIIFAINGLVQKTLPFAWGDDVLYLKNDYYQKHQADYNTIFLGGSLVYRHIDCQLLDSMTNANGLATRSFNMGVDGLNMPKQMWVIDELLENDTENLDYLFVTLSSTSRFLFLNMHTRKFVTWNNWSTLKHSIGVLRDIPYGIKQRVKTAYYYLLTTLENKVHAGLGEDIIEFQTHRRNHPDLTYLGKNKDGFYPYNYEESHIMMSQNWEEELLIASKRAYEGNPEKREQLVKKTTEEFENFQPKDKFSKSILKAYMSAIDKAAAKGVKLIVVMPPRTRENYDIFLQVYERLPKENKINLASPIQYPEFYTLENSYNFHHLNFRGAKLYTKEQARQFLELEGKTAP